MLQIGPGMLPPGITLIQPGMMQAGAAGVMQSLLPMVPQGLVSGQQKGDAGGAAPAFSPVPTGGLLPSMAPIPGFPHMLPAGLPGAMSPEMVMTQIRAMQDSAMWQNSMAQPTVVAEGVCVAGGYYLRLSMTSACREAGTGRETPATAHEIDTRRRPAWCAFF